MIETMIHSGIDSYCIHVLEFNNVKTNYILRVELLLIPVAALALLFNHEFSVMEVLWAFSIYLEAVAILPQLFMVSKVTKPNLWLSKTHTNIEFNRLGKLNLLPHTTCLLWVRTVLSTS